MLDEVELKQTLDSQLAAIIAEIKTTLLKTLHEVIASETQRLKKQILDQARTKRRILPQRQCPNNWNSRKPKFR